MKYNLIILLHVWPHNEYHIYEFDNINIYFSYSFWWLKTYKIIFLLFISVLGNKEKKKTANMLGTIF
jgi:hypothetical protein